MDKLELLQLKIIIKTVFKNKIIFKPLLTIIEFLIINKYIIYKDLVFIRDKNSDETIITYIKNIYVLSLEIVPNNEIKYNRLNKKISHCNFHLYKFNEYDNVLEYMQIFSFDDDNVDNEELINFLNPIKNIYAN